MLMLHLAQTITRGPQFSRIRATLRTQILKAQVKMLRVYALEESKQHPLYLPGARRVQEFVGGGGRGARPSLETHLSPPVATGTDVLMSHARSRATAGL